MLGSSLEDRMKPTQFTVEQIIKILHPKGYPS